MNYIDIGILGLLALSFLIGLIRRPRKCIVGFFVVAISVVAAYFTFNMVGDKVFAIEIEGEPLKDFAVGKLTELLGEDSPIDPSTLVPLVEQLIRLIIFVVECIGLFIVVGIFGNLFKGNGKYRRAIRNGTPIRNPFIFRIVGAIFNTARFAAVLSVFLIPVFVLVPLVKNANNLSSLIQVDNLGDTLNVASEQTNNSKVINFVDKLFTIEGNKLVEYTQGDKTKNLYSDLSSISDLTKALPLINALSDENTNPIEALSNMSTDDLTAVLEALDENKELITSLVPAETFTDIGIDLETISFAEEAPVITKVLEIVEFSEEGEMTFDETKLEDQQFVEGLAEAFAGSNLIEAIAEPGMLADIPAESKTTIENKLTELKGKSAEEGGITQEKYDALMALFTAQQADAS